MFSQSAVLSRLKTTLLRSIVCYCTSASAAVNATEARSSEKLRVEGLGFKV
jgi:hypothetical protein